MDDIQNSRWIGPLGIVLLVLVVMLVWAFRSPIPPAHVAGTVASTTAMYSSDAYGITFQYPNSYALTEAQRGNGERALHVVTLVRKTGVPPPKDGEGPPTIELAFYQNNLDKLSAVAWVKNDSRSNWKLGDGTLATTTVSGVPAVFYRWSGLYEGATLAFPHKGNIVTASVTYLTPEDENIRVFQDILSSLRLR